MQHWDFIVGRESRVRQACLLKPPQFAIAAVNLVYGMKFRDMYSQGEKKNTLEHAKENYNSLPWLQPKAQGGTNFKMHI